MSEFRDATDKGVECDGRLARRLADLDALPAAPPAPGPVIALIRQRRRRRRAVQTGASALVIAMVAIVAVRFATPPTSPAPGFGPGLGPHESTVRWAHLTDPALPSAHRLRHSWLQTGDLPAASDGGASPAAVRAPLRPVDAMDAAALDPLG